MPVKNSSGRGFCAGFWNKIRRKKSPSRSEQVSNPMTQSATKTNPQTSDDGLSSHERPLVVKLTTINSTEHPSSDECSLWDQAYNVLEERDPDGIFKAYHVIFSRLYAEFQDGATPSPPAPHAGSRNQPPILPSFENPVPRRELLSAVANLGLQQMKDKEIAIRLWGHELHPNNAMIDVISVIEAIQKIVQDAVRDLPNAALAMAGVSLVLPLLLNPSAAENDNLRGFDYVTSQMRYYIEMEVLFLPAELQVSVRDELKRQIRALYEKIIEYEIRSVLHFFSSRVTRFFKGSILFDDWKGKLEEIQELENIVQQRLGSAVSGESMKHLNLLKADATIMRQGVDSMVSELHTASNVLQRLERLELDKEDQKYLASLLATDPRLAKRALQSAKEQPLRDSYEWIFGDEQLKQWQTDGDKNQLWISGDPGKGKTMLLCGMIDKFTIEIDKHLNVSFFFCQATDASFNNANAVVRGLLCMLVKQQPALMAHIRKSCQNGMGKKQFRGTTAWEALSVVFTEVLNDPMLNRTYLIVDALDECVNDQLCLLKLILATSHLKGAKWLVSSRNDLIWPQVDDQELCNDSTVPFAKRRVHLKLEDKQDSIATSIDAYILNAVGSLKQKKQLDDINVDLIKHHLVQNAEGTFLWVALVCKALAHPDVLGGDIKRQLASLPKGLKPLYSEMLKRIRHSEYESLYRQLLSIMSAVFRPVTFVELRSLSSQLLKDYDDGDLEQRIARCGSFLTVKDKTVSFVHKSAKDYLLSEESSVAGSSDASAQHYTVFLAALELLTSTLRRNMCKLDFLGPLSEQDSQPDLESLVPISYATVFWLDHFKNSAFKDCFDPARQKKAASLVCNFIKEKYLYWLEALSLLKSLARVMGPLNELSGFMTRLNLEHNRCLMEDAYCFLQLNKFVIDEAPMQLYVSALLFSPDKNLIKQIFKDRNEVPKSLTIQRGAKDSRQDSIRPLGAHEDKVTCLAFSHDSQWLASGSLDKTIRIWDISTGDCLRKISCNYSVRSISLSGDSLQLVSCSSTGEWGLQPGSLELWNTRTGAKQRTFDSHVLGPRSVALSDDGQRLALVSGSGLQIWDTNTKTGTCLRTLHEDAKMRAVAISSDSRYIAAGGPGSTLSLWEMGTNDYHRIEDVHDKGIWSLAFLHDSGRLACGSGNTVRIWNLHARECQTTLEGHDFPVMLLNYSPKSRTLASGSGDGILKLWDTGSNCCLQTFLTPAFELARAFCYDTQQLAVSTEEKIEIWDMSLNAGTPATIRPKIVVVEVAILNNGQNFMTLSSDAAMLWDTISGDCLHTYAFANPDEERSKRRVLVPANCHNQRQVVFSDGNDVIVWDTCSSDPERDAHLTTLGGHDQQVTAVAISADGRRVVSKSLRDAKVWDVKSGDYLLLDGSFSEYSWKTLAISADGQQAASKSNGGLLSVWNTRTGQLSMATEAFGRCYAYERYGLVFSLDGRRLAFLWDADAIGMMEFDSKKRLRLETDQFGVTSIAFSDDGHRIVSSGSNSVKIWKCTSGQCLQAFYIARDLGRVSFDPQNNDRLLADRGAVEIKPVRKSRVGRTSINPVQYGISHDGSWIEHYGRKVCWIPSVYRSHFYAVKGSVICVACETGLAWSATLKLE